MSFKAKFMDLSMAVKEKTHSITVGKLFGFVTERFVLTSGGGSTAAYPLYFVFPIAAQVTQRQASDL